MAKLQRAYVVVMLAMIAEFSVSTETNSKALLNLNQSEQGRLPSEDLLQLFTRKQVEIIAPNAQKALVPYYLYQPTKLEPQVKYSLIIWLPGQGPIESQYSHMGFMNWVDSFLTANESRIEHHDFFLLVPGGARFAIEYGDHSESERKVELSLNADIYEIVIAMLDHAIMHHPIDPDRVSITGISKGGAACWELAMRYPQRFAAIAPLASPGGDTSRAELLKEVPIWAFHNKYDTETPIDGDRNMVAAVNSSGGKAYLTELERGGHNAWIAAMKQYDLRSWLLAQTRGQEVILPHTQLTWGTRMYHFIYAVLSYVQDSGLWKNLLVISIGVVIIIAYQQERKRRLSTTRHDLQ